MVNNSINPLLPGGRSGLKKNGTENHTLQLKHTLEQLKNDLVHDLSKNGNIVTITRRLVTAIDEIIITLFKKHHLDEHKQICLLALGSYGRHELQLHSDIDLLLLHDDNITDACLQRAQRFLQDCWDAGLDVSHQLTTVTACSNLAAQELSVISSILDMRVLCGPSSFMDELRYQTQPLHMWTSHDYFFAKQQEQLKRYEKYDETAYNLEPNIKYGPGGLRDLQVLLAIGKRHFGIHKLADGIAVGFITDKEYEELLHCQQFLMRVRAALHGLANKREERLLFDYQIKLASLFGFTDNSNILAIEQFMKEYFNVIKRSRDLNDMLLQWFSETILYEETHRLIPLDDTFQLSNHYIEIRHPRALLHNSQTLLQLFLWIAKRPDILGVRASTIRLIRQNLYLITNQYCATTHVTDTFMAILKTGNNPYHALQCMSQYGVLGHYLTCFAAVTGQMQYDLFHVYTVEQHTLFVIRNLARFNLPNYAKQFPLASRIMPTIAKHEILYLAGLFHDIAKGRGGDHSELGAIEAATFSQQHHLDDEDQALLIWLVQNHLLMSKTIQRQDIYDPKTIENFCGLLPKSEYLDYLYLLTVADICATNPTLWNAWKDSLLKELYFSTKQALHQEQVLLDESALIKMRCTQALEILLADNASDSDAFARDINNLWHNFKGNYFLHESPDIIARHTKAILKCKQFPLVLIMPHHSQGGTEVFIYMPHRDERFTITTTVLSNHHVTIQEANITTCNNQFDLDTYIILNEQNQAFLDNQQTESIRSNLATHLENQVKLPTVTKRRLSRAQAHFNLTPQITYTQDNKRQHTCLFLITNDRPGLLAHVSQIFLTEKIHLHHAKIATAGERVEDMFYISNDRGEMLTKKEQTILREKLLEHGALSGLEAD